MTKDIWLNLPVKDIKRSKKFFSILGFTFNPRFEKSTDTACLIIGKKELVVMLFEETIFCGFTQHPLANTGLGSEILISIDAESPDEVDELAKKATEAGANLFSPPAEHDWMYGCSFADLDGHRWNILYMDYSKMPKE